ncbi:uncharacterized protein LOC143019381 [Oratosquilla oratoria]|uniref:uncharacterized protein LOC143019381 n=1 Tax=Oratosquilla oratoria TaxID=337810 RepID=UPI003F776E90
MIDLFLVRDKRTARDVKSIPSASLDSDHRLVICKLSVLRPKKMQRATRNRIKVEKLKEQDTIDGFQMLAAEGLQTVALTDVHQTWSELKTKINDIAENTLGSSQTGVTKKKLTIWWNEEVKNAVRDKNKTYRQWMKRRSEATRNIYVAARNKAEQIKRIAKQEVWIQLAEDLGNAFSNDKKFIYSLAKSYKKDTKLNISTIKDQHGKLLTDSHKVRERWGEYFSQLLNV